MQVFLLRVNTHCNPVPSYIAQYHTVTLLPIKSHYAKGRINRCGLK